MPATVRLPVSVHHGAVAPVASWRLLEAVEAMEAMGVMGIMGAMGIMGTAMLPLNFLKLP